MRFLILHHHIFKNAGTTLDSSLSQQFGSDFMQLERDGQLISSHVLFNAIAANPTLRAVSSHSFMGQAFTDIAEALDCRFFHFALLRKPWDRLVSMHNFYQRGGLDDIFCRTAREMPIDGFITWLLRNYPNQVNSPQVNMFASRGFYGRPVCDRDVEDAWGVYRDFALCAPVERFDEAMVVLEYFNSPVYMPRGLQMEYVARNRSSRLASVPDLKAMLSQQDLASIDELARHDEALWQLANQELDRRISLVPDFEARLNDFRLRCDRLRNGDAARD